MEAVNDGKTAAWHIHAHLQALHGLYVDPVPRLPQFYTGISEHPNHEKHILIAQRLMLWTLA